MKMNRSIVIFSLITLNMKIVNSSSFCTDPEDYECKHLGITKCVPKLNRSTTQKPLPIEKLPCAVPCLDTDSWCEERGACIDKDEHCDCGPDKIYCTSEDAYICMSRKGILQSDTFNICRNGECRKNCTMAEEEGTEGCEEGQFRCGETCLDNVDIVQFKTCNKHCISVHKTCFAKQEEVSLVFNNSEIGLPSDSIAFGFLIVILLAFLILAIYSFENKNLSTFYIKQNYPFHNRVSRTTLKQTQASTQPLDLTAEYIV